MEDTKPEAPKPVVPPPQAPTQGRGRQIDPPSDATISIRELKAVPNFNSLLGLANYQATMQLENGDSAWTAEKLCAGGQVQRVQALIRSGASTISSPWMCEPSPSRILE